MFSYILKRLLYAVPIALSVTLFSFLLVYLAPGDPLNAIAPSDAPAEVIAALKAAYGLDFIAPQGVSTESEVSARDLARIITQIKRQRIPAVFIENITDPRLVKRIAEETGAKIGGTLYSDALTDAGGAAPTYIDMVRHNIRALGDALIS